MFLKELANDIINKIKKDYTYKSLILTFLIVLLFFLPSGIVLDNEYKKDLLSNKREEIKSQLKDYSMLLNRVINDRFSLLKALEVYTKENWNEDIKESDFNQFAYGLYSSNSGIRNLIIAPEGVNKYVYPIENNKEAVGHNLLEDKRPEVRKAVKETIDSKNYIANGPYNLRQGGEGIILRKALYKNSNFWGLITMTLDMGPIYEYVELKNENSPINIALKREGEIFFGEKNIFKKNSVNITLSYQGGEFDIAGAPNKGWDDSIKDNLIVFRMLLFGIMFLFAIITYILSYRNFKVQSLVENKTKHLKEKNLLLQEKKEKISEQKEELSASYDEIEAYTEEVIAMNDELEESFEKVNLLNQRFVNMIELVSNMEGKTLMSEKEFFADLLKSAIEIIPEADYGKICIINEQDQCEFIDAVGHDINILEEIRFDKKLLFHKDSKTINTTNNYFFDIDKIKPKTKEDFMKGLNPIKNSLYINFLIDGQTVGRMALDIKRDSSKEFSDTTKKVLKSFSTLASSFFAFKRFDDLQTNFTKELITSIIKIMEMYDLYTKGHSENVAKLASAIAKKMNLSKSMIRDTYWSGLVHDIGKLLIPINILNKKERLTDKEFELIKKHPVWGNKALSSSKILKPISRYILHHHERWNGRGYPKRLKGNEIPLISQILGVADAWDAMLSKRAYRDSLSIEAALEEIKTNKGTQFSPQVVEAFIKIIENDKIEQLQQDVLDNEINEFKSKNHLLDSKESFEDLFKKSNEGIAILDSDFNIIRANNYFLNMFGYDKQKIIGEKIKKIVPSDKIAEVENHLNLLAKGEKLNTETIRKKENGEKIKVSIQAFPVSLNGNDMGYYVIYRDITELEETKSKYKNIKNRYKALFENENTVMLIIDPDNGEIVEANPAATNFYGWNKEVLTSMKITDINVLSKEEVQKEMLKAKEKARNYFNFRHRTANDKIKDVEVYSQPIPFADKEYLYSIIHEKQKNKNI